MAGTLLLVIAGVIALLATTHVEHPREEAAEAAAEEKAVEEGKPAEGGKPARVAESRGDRRRHRG